MRKACARQRPSSIPPPSFYSPRGEIPSGLVVVVVSSCIPQRRSRRVRLRVFLLVEVGTVFLLHNPGGGYVYCICEIAPMVVLVVYPRESTRDLPDSWVRERQCVGPPFPIALSPTTTPCLASGLSTVPETPVPVSEVWALRRERLHVFVKGGPPH